MMTEPCSLVIFGSTGHEVSWAWQVVDPVLKLWATERDFIPTYAAGSWGPAEATRLFDRDDQNWRDGLEQ